MLDTIKSKLKHFWELFQSDIAFNKKLHGWCAVFWLAASLPICIWLSTCIPFLVFISVYAVVGFHWNIWFNSTVEKRHEENPVADEVLDRLDTDTDVEVVSKTTTEETTISS